MRHGYIHQIEGEVSRHRLGFQLGSLFDFLRGKFSPSQFSEGPLLAEDDFNAGGPIFAGEARLELKGGGESKLS